MFERYTESARRVLFFSRHEASQLGSLTIEPEHLLLGLIRESAGITSRIFARSHVSLENIRKEIVAGLLVRDKIPDSVEIPFGGATKRVLQLAAEEADRLLHHDIDTEHLLLGIFREEQSAAAAILVKNGVRIEWVRDQIVELLHEPMLGSRPFAGNKPDLPPSDEVHISPTTRRPEAGPFRSAGSDHWAALGFELKEIIAQAYGEEETRIDLPPDLDAGQRYDVAMVLPRTESPHVIDRLVQQAIETHFGLTITRETRPMDVYVLTASESGPAPQALPESGGGGFLASFAEFAVPHDGTLPKMSELLKTASGAFGQMSSETTIGMFCLALERSVGRPFVDETNLTGMYNLEVQSSGGSAEDFLRALRDQSGLIATPDTRDVTLLVVRRRQPEGGREKSEV